MRIAKLKTGTLMAIAFLIALVPLPIVAIINHGRSVPQLHQDISFGWFCFWLGLANVPVIVRKEFSFYGIDIVRGWPVVLMGIAIMVFWWSLLLLGILTRLGW